MAQRKLQRRLTVFTDNMDAKVIWLSDADLGVESDAVVEPSSRRAQRSRPKPRRSVKAETSNQERNTQTCRGSI